MKRSEKIALLSKVINGQVSPQDLKRLKDEQAPWFMVITNGGSPQPTDLVDTRLPDEQGRKRISYAEFLKNPVVYGSFCVTVN
jgi:hypothetical protein